MKKTSQSKQYKTTTIISIIAVLVGVIAINVISSYWFTKIDLTQDKRHSLSESTIDLLKESDDIISVKIFMKGENIPIEYEPIIDKAEEMLKEFRDITPNIRYEFIDPFEGKTEEEVKAILAQYADKGLTPLPLRKEYKSATETQTKYLIPGGIISYKNRECVTTLIETDYRNKYSTEDYSYMHLEYNFVMALKHLIKPHKCSISFIEGDGEINALNRAWFATQLGVRMKDYYQVAHDTIDERINCLRNIAIADSNAMTVKDMGNKYDLLIIAQPVHRLKSADLYAIDQHIMRGGKVLWLIDATNVSLDSLEKKPDFMAYENFARHGLEKMFFRYGVRINPNLIQDIGSCQAIPLSNKQLMIYPYALNITNFEEHPITQKIESVSANFASTIDFVGKEDNLKKTVLATTSTQTKVVQTPCIVSLKVGLNRPNPEEYKLEHQPVAVLVEGEFQSAFDGRLPLELDTVRQFNNLHKSKATKQIFISDGDMAFNYFMPTQFRADNYVGLDETMLRMGIKPTGFDIYTNRTYDNAEFLINCVDYLCDNVDLINLRSKVFQMGLLDQNQIIQTKVKRRYQFVNIVLPLAIFVLLGCGLLIYRKQRYTRRKLSA